MIQSLSFDVYLFSHYFTADEVIHSLLYKLHVQYVSRLDNIAYAGLNFRCIVYLFFLLTNKVGEICKSIFHFIKK